MQPADQLVVDHGYALVKFFFLLTFAAAIPAIISGGIAERARFAPQLCATVLIVAFVYPFFEGVVWNGNFGLPGRTMRTARAIGLAAVDRLPPLKRRFMRSEEHTSELQSLMRNSYAVFCLKK